jgi:L-aspartate oxidase
MTQIDLVQRLNSADPGWTINADVIVIGSGIAGLTAALSARDKGLSVLLLTKDVLSTGSTSWAQGGIAAALGPGDSPDQHFQDTLEAGAGLCDQDSVRILVQEGPAAVKRLINLGATFDLDPSGNVALTREGGHRRDRIAHAGGDATGAEISRALVAKVLADPKVRIFEHALVLDLLKDKNERVCGVTLHVMGKGKIDGVGAALARAALAARTSARTASIAVPYCSNHATMPARHAASSIFCSQESPLKDEDWHELKPTHGKRTVSMPGAAGTGSWTGCALFRDNAATLVGRHRATRNA